MESRLSKQNVIDNVNDISFVVFIITLVLFVVLCFTNLKILLLVDFIIFTASLIVAVVFSKLKSPIVSPVFEKLKSINWWKDREYEIDGATIRIRGFGKDSKIKIGIPNLIGAKLTIGKSTYEVSDAMETALNERGITPLEFYLKYIEVDLLNCMTATYNEINANKIRAGNCVFEFMDKKDGKL